MSSTASPCPDKVHRTDKGNSTMNIFRCAFVWATIPVLAAAATGKRTNGHEQLRIVMVDAEGGAASLFVDPHGHSLLVDTGWGSNSPPARAAPNGTPAP